MLQRRYPYTSAGKLAGAAFLLAGFVAGWLAGSRVPHGPGELAGGIVWAIVAAGVAYLVFASEGPARRPEAGWQAGMADGLVTGVIAGGIGAAIDLLVASGGGSLSGGTILRTVGGSIALIATIGAAVGLALGYLPAMARTPTGGKKRRTRQLASRAVGRVADRPASPSPAARVPGGPSGGARGSSARRKSKRR